MEYTKYKKGLITHSIKLNKVCQCLLFTHVLTLPCKFNNENVRMYSSLTQFSRVSPQKNNYTFLIYICIVLYCIVYMQNKLYTAHTIRHGITKPTCSLISLQPCYDKEHMIFYKLVKVCKYNLR